MKKKITAILAVCMLADSITACGGSKAPEETEAPAPAETTAAVQTETETEAEPETETEAEPETETEAETEAETLTRKSLRIMLPLMTSLFSTFLPI